MPNWFFGIGEAAFIGKPLLIRIGKIEIALVRGPRGD
jgi:hypothetical protein